MNQLEQLNTKVVAVIAAVIMFVALPVMAVQLVNAEATTVSESLSCTVSGGTCNVTASQPINTLTSVTQTVPISADKTGDSTVGGDNRTITITSIASS